MIVDSPAADAQKLRRAREEAWRESIEECSKCGAPAARLMFHEDGVQCFSCFHIIYMPDASVLAELFPDPEALLQEVDKQANPSPLPAPPNQDESDKPDLKPVEKPENWKKMSQRAKRAWYDEHKEEITRDYNNNSSMSRDAVLEKWGISASTLWLYSKRWGIVSKRKKGPRPAAGNKVDRPLLPKRIEHPVLVITKKDLVNCSDAKFTKIWNTLGQIIRARTSAKDAVDMIILPLQDPPEIKDRFVIEGIPE